MKTKAKQKNRAMVTAPGGSPGRLFVKKAKQIKAEQSKQIKTTFAWLPFRLHVLVSTEPCLEKMNPGWASSSMYRVLCMIFR